jgi:hypothetical protein
MKNAFNLFALLSVSVILLPSCSDNCCMLGVNKICEEDLEGSGHATWSDYQEYLEGLGYNCE